MLLHITNVAMKLYNITLKIIEILNMHSAVQTAAVAIISYTQHYGSLHALFSFEV